MKNKIVASFWAIMSEDARFYGTVHLEHESEENPACDSPEWFESPVDPGVEWFASRKEAGKRAAGLDCRARAVRVEVSIDAEEDDPV